MSIDLTGLLSCVVRKTLEYNKIKMSKEEIDDFTEKLLADEEFLEEYKNIIK